MAGILPFGAMFIELFFIFTAIWENQFYYLFGFLFLVFIILAISCSQIAIVMVYFQLCGEVNILSNTLYALKGCKQLRLCYSDRIITGGGAVSSYPEDRPSTSSLMPSFTSSPSWKSPNSRRPYCTLATLLWCVSPSGCWPAQSASTLRISLWGKSIPLSRSTN